MKKFLLGAILVFIGAMLVVTLIPGVLDLSGPPRDGIVAEVGNEVITVEQVEMQARRIGQQRFQRVPEGILPFLRQQAAQTLITTYALVEEATRMGLRATEEELRDELRQGQLGQILYPDGEFIGTEGYMAFLQQQNLGSIQQFETLVRQQIAIRKLTSMVEGSVVVPPAEIEEAYRRQNLQVRFDYAVVQPQDMLKEIRVTDAELQQFFQQNQARYENAIPERRRVRYAVIDPSAVAGQVEVTDSDLRRVYEQRQEMYRTPESVNVRHILLQTPTPGPDGPPSEEAIAKVRENAEKILQQLRDGADFAAMARKHSQDPGSAQAGGLYEGVTRGRMVPEFENAAFTLPVGQVSDLVRTSYGFHILRVESRQEARVRPLQEVRAELEPLARQEQVFRRMESEVRSLETEARTRGLEDAAQRRNVKVVTSDWVTRFDPLPGIGGRGEVNEFIFAARQGGPAESHFTGQAYVIFEIAEIQPARAPQFEEIRDRVAADFRNERAQQLAAQRVTELSDRARAAASLRQAAKELGVQVRSSDFVRPGATVPEVGPLEGPTAAVFAMRSGEVSGPLPAGNGGVVFAVTDRREPDMAGLEAQREQLAETVLQRKRMDVLELYISNLRREMEDGRRIRWNETERQRLEGGALQQRRN